VRNPTLTIAEQTGVMPYIYEAGQTVGSPMSAVDEDAALDAGRLLYVLLNETTPSSGPGSYSRCTASSPPTVHPKNGYSTTNSLSAFSRSNPR
jgi:hypothetical protein